MREPKDHSAPIHEVLIEMTNGGLDYTFEAVGNVELMRSALEACKVGVNHRNRRGWRRSGNFFCHSSWLLDVCGAALRLVVFRAQPTTRHG